MSNIVKHLQKTLLRQPRLLFLIYLLACCLIVALPGFLWFYFWEDAGFFISVLIGFLIGNFVLGLLNVLCMGGSKRSQKLPQQTAALIQSTGEHPQPLSLMKHRLGLFVTSLVTFVLGWLAGSAVQHGKTGWHYDIRHSKVIPTEMGSVQWSYVTESEGLPILDPGTTVLEWNNRVIYKAKRMPRESNPFADDVRSSGKSIDWQDGQYRFHLTIEDLESPTKE